MASSSWRIGLIPRQRLAIAVMVMLLRAAAASHDAIAAGPQQQSFASPGEAVQALVAAAKAGDVETLTAILGSEARDLIASGDPVADKDGRMRFVRAYEQSNKLERPKIGRAHV